MLMEHLVLLGATNLQKSMTESVKAVNSHQVCMEKMLHIHLLVKVLTPFPKIHFTTRLQAQLCSKFI